MKRYIKPLSLAFLYMLLGAGALLGEEGPMVLSRQWVIEEALRSNPDIQAALNRWEASEAAVGSAKSLDDPILNVHTWNAQSPITVEPKWSRTERRGVVSQKVPFPGKLHLRGKIASEGSMMVKKDWEQKVLDVLARVKGAYYQLHFVYKAIDINEKNRDLLVKFSKVAEVRYKVGKAPQRDVLAAQVELSKVIKDLRVLAEEKRAAETRINTLLNREPEQPLGRPEDYTMHKLDLDLKEMEALATKNRPELQKSDFAVKRSKSSLNLAKKDFHFPDPEFTVMYMQTDTQPDMWMSQIAFNVPWVWGKNRAKVREAKENLQASEADYKGVQNAVLFEVKDTWVKATNAATTAQIYSDSVIPLAEQSVKAASQEYETEKVDFLTLIDSQRTLLRAELDYYRAAADFETNLAELERAIGMALTPEGP